MATVVLTTLGGAVGGPVGAALGALTGRMIDGAVFGQRTRTGPRLHELQVQTSSYGTAIPQLFGTIRVAGTVIWATDLRESATTGGGKGTGRTTNYSYSASFAVALSARPIVGVRRIWAEGKLLRGAGGDWKTRTGFRLYRGDETQLPDPLIESIVGIGNAPAHRGIAYAVFEDLALADFGNRIPSLTFEVEADAAPVPVGRIVELLSDGAIRSEAAGPVPGGFAASGARVRDAVDALVEPIGGWYAPEGEGVVLRTGIGPARMLPGDAPDAAWHRPPVAPVDVAIAYHDIDRDYQIGVQQVRRAGATGVERIELPAAMTADAAARLAGDAAARAGRAVERRTMTLDWQAIDIVPGERVTIMGEAGLWRVRRVGVETGGVRVELVPVAAATLPPAAATGTAQLAPDVMAGATRLRLVELPADDGDGGAGLPRIVAVAAGTRAGWRRALLSMGDAAGGWQDAGLIATPGTIGVAATVLPRGPATVEDRTGVVEVALLHDAMTLADADAAALDRGANAGLIGDELVQFGMARRTGPGRWRLSRLWRGRRGTEWAIPAHLAGEAFVLLDPATLHPVGDPAVGRALRAMAVGIAPDDVAEAAIVPDGRGTVPPAPVHVTLRRADDMLTIAWVRRGRGGWTWRDAIDVPLGEEREAYRVTLRDADGAERSVDSAVPWLRIAVPSGATRIEIRQIGTHGPSRPAMALYEPETP